jgi:RHS repeat-associated protein
MAGRLTSETNPETGTVSYTYDSACGSYSASAGDLTKRVDNAGNTTCYAYDALHRVTDAGYSGPICRHYRYDNSPTPYNGGTPPTGVTVSNTLTRLEEASTDQCSFTTLQTDEWFSYSPRGELTDVYESTPNSGTYYHTTASYWASGALESLSGIPSVPTLYYGGSSGAGLDGEGRYTQVTASSSPNPVTSVSYSTSSTSNPLGALTGVTYGSSDNDSFSYDPNTGRAATYSYSVNGSADTGTLTWNTNGTLASLVISDAISGTSDSQSCTFTYDDLARIGGQDANGYSADCGPAWQQLFSYDAFGNINKSGSLSFTPTYTTTTPTNQFSSIPGVSGPYYDSNGNLTTDNLNTYTWDPNWGNMTSVSTGSTTVTASYDALGRVVEQGSGSGYAQILWSPAGKAAIMNGTTLTKAFVGLPGGGTAVYTSSGLAYYRHADWLGSSRLASTQAQGLYSSTAYAPFGESYATAGTTDASFTGQNSDTVSSLYDFIFRRESPSQGRWISPDPAGLAAVDPTTPQTWNRYGYVANNPTGNIDQMGLWRQFPGACASSADYQCGGGYIGPGWGGDPGSGGGTFVWISNWQEVTTVNTNPEVVGTDNDPWQAQIIGTEWDDFGQFVYLSGPSISLPQTQNPGGPGGSAPSNGTKSPSCGKAWGKAIAGTLLDATGLIPGEGTIASGIKIAGTLGGIALSASGSFQDAAAGGVFTGVGMYADATKQDIQTLGKDVAEGIPGLGTIVSGVAVVWDLGSGAKSIYNCYQGVTE